MVSSQINALLKLLPLFYIVLNVCKELIFCGHCRGTASPRLQGCFHSPWILQREGWRSNKSKICSLWRTAVQCVGFRNTETTTSSSNTQTSPDHKHEGYMNLQLHLMRHNGTKNSSFQQLPPSTFFSTFIPKALPWRVIKILGFGHNHVK